ncbi:GNAT family N-acetyltransferase [Rhodococcus hoagii]|nr:GNAT family N-acetyltransferase [Prescottella equi]
MSTTGEKATVADVEDIGESADVLAEAFATDPLMAWIWQTQKRRRAALPTFFASSLRDHIRHGVIDIARGDSGAAIAVAVWDAPGATSSSALDTLRSAPRLLRALRTRVATASRVRAALEQQRPHEPHWYLSNIGVLDFCRGQGLAAALLRKRLADVDEAGMPAYLVCTRPENIALYEHFGFTVTQSFTLPDDGPPMWGMWRSPR